MATPNLIDLKAFLDIDATIYDDELEVYLSSATSTIAHRCGPLSVTNQEEQHDVACGDIVVHSWPVVALTSVTRASGESVDVSDARVLKDAGVIRVPGLSGDVDVEYEAGYDPCPDDLELAVYVTAGHLWDTQRGRSGSFTQVHGMDDDAPVGGDASYYVLQGYALPRRAMELTRPYTKAGFR